MKKRMMTLLAALMAAGLLSAQAQESSGRFGGGVNYWVALDDIDIDDVDEDGFSYFITYKKESGLFGLQLDLEYFDSRFQDDAYAPAAYLIAGNAIYLSAGIGWVYENDWADDPFYALKTGLDIALTKRIHLDLGVSYRVEGSVDLDDAIDDIDTDTLYLGAAVRFGL